MKKLFLAALLLPLLVINAAAQVDKDWVKFEPEGAGFSVRLPSKPVEQPSDNKALHMFSLTIGRSVFAISYADRAPGKTLNVQKVLESNRDNFNQKFSAKLLTSRNLTLENWPGLEFTSESPAANIKSRVFLVGNREYQLVGLVFRDVEMGSVVDIFLESFTFSSK